MKRQGTTQDAAKADLRGKFIAINVRKQNIQHKYE